MADGVHRPVLQKVPVSSVPVAAAIFPYSLSTASHGRSGLSGLTAYAPVGY